MEDHQQVDEQTTLPGVPVPEPAVQDVRRRTRTVRFDCSVKGEKQVVHVSIFDGMVGFRPHRARKEYTLDIDTWVGLGFCLRVEARRQRRKGGA